MTSLIRSCSVCILTLFLFLFGCGDMPLIPTTGALHVQSTPTGAAVFVDGVATGLVTDCNVTDLAGGLHQVLLRLDGYADATGEVEVVAGEQATFEATLGAVLVELAPDTPTGLAVEPGEGSLTLTWLPAGGASSYTLYWTSDRTEPTSDSAAIEIAAPGYTHDGLDPWLKYRYRVSASNAKGESGLSASVSGTPKPRSLAPPSAIRATVTGTMVSLRWDEVPLGGVTYAVWRGTSPWYGSQVASGFCTARYSEPLPSAGVTWFYRVKVLVAGDGESAWSAPVLAWSRPTVVEREPNNPPGWAPSNYPTGDDRALGLDHFTLKGAYDVSAAVFVPDAERYFDVDVFQVSAAPGDAVTIAVQQGVTAGGQPMRVDLVCVTRSRDDVLVDERLHSFTGDGGTWPLPTGLRCAFTSLEVVMPADVQVHGGFSYRVDVSIARH